MSNALERTGQRMNEELARLRQERATPRPVGPAPSVSASSFAGADPARFPSSAVFHRSVCAVFDLFFDERFERQASGLYRMVETIRIHEGDGGRRGVSPRRALAMREIEGRYLPCPWCGDNAGKRYHCDCGTPVCGGRVRGNLFICRDSCGDKWEMGPPAREIQVTDAIEERDFRGPSRGPAMRQAPPRDLRPARLLAAPKGR
jgi:hypothetical protein